MQNMSAVTLTD